MNQTIPRPFRPGVLIQRLRDAQNQPPWYLTDAELVSVAHELGISLAEVQDVASYYSLFRLKPPPAGIWVRVQICRDMSCRMAGVTGERIENWNGEFSKKHAGVTCSVEGVSCLGRCDRAPVMLVSRHDPKDHSRSFHDAIFGRYSLSPEQAWEYLGGIIEQACSRTVVAMSLCEAIDGAIVADADADFQTYRNSDWRIDPYQGSDMPPYAMAQAYLKEFGKPITPSKIEDLVKDDKKVAAEHKTLALLEQAKLLGMGGAGTPAYSKWKDVWLSPETEKYIVCNGDESEPGTFKDRELLLRYPHLVVEGAILAGLMLNAPAGYIFIRHEYREGIDAVRRAISEAEAAGVCGPSIWIPDSPDSPSRSFILEVFDSPGGYICGEQGALLEAMSDRRAQPRPRPPEPQTNGLNDKPTLVSNVESFAWVPFILQPCSDANPAYEKLGHAESDGTSFYKGRRLFSISGDVRNPGVFEVPIGLPLKALIELAGGMYEGQELFAVAPSGPSSGIVFRTLPHDPAFVDRQIARSEGKPNTPMLATLRRLRDQQFRIEELPLDLNIWRGLALFDDRAPSENRPPKVALGLGAGIVIYDDSRRDEIFKHALNLTEFFAHETCGKCIPCRLGAPKLVQVGTELLKPNPDMNEATRILDLLTPCMRESSLCSLGMSAPNALANTLACVEFQAKQSRERANAESPTPQSM